MRYLYLFFFIIFTSAVFAQSKTVYLKANNQFTLSRDSANVYMVIEGPGKDSLYTMKQYNTRDSILVSGTFKDSTLTMQNGKFVFYYTPAESYAWRKANIIGADTNKYIKTIGYYIDSKKTGVWLTYELDGELENTSTYTNDAQTGPARFIDNTPTGLTAHFYDGNYNDGKRDGEWKVTSLYGRLEETRFYHDDQLAKTVVNRSVDKGIIQPSAPGYFKAYLNKGLASNLKSGPDKKIIVKLTVGKDGAIKNVFIFSGFDDAVKNQAVIELVKSSGKWKAGSIDKHVAEMTTFCTITYSSPVITYTLSKY